MSPPIVTLLTDFGEADGYTGILKGVILAIAPEARIVDLSHQIPPQDITAGALVLRSAAPYFPADTIHVAIVDPGVGSARHAIAIRTRHGTFIGPDNGVLSLAVGPAADAHVREISNPAWLRPDRSNTFHGRDIFAPAAGHLAAGADFDECGPSRSRFEELLLPAWHEVPGGEIAGEILYRDRFGNLVTNLDDAALARFRHSRVSVSIRGIHVRGLVSSYAAARDGELLAIMNSWNLLEIARKNGSAADELGAGPGTPLTVRGASESE